MGETGEKKTHLRVLFEESMKAPAKFSFFAPEPQDSEQDDKPKEEHSKRIKLDRSGSRKLPLTEVFLLAEAELKRRWPEPVGKKFVRTEENKEKWLETKEKLKAETKKQLKQAVRKGMAKPKKKKAVGATS